MTSGPRDLWTRFATGACVAAVLCGLTGCDTSSTDPDGRGATSPAAAACQGVDESVFALGGIADFQPMSPAELLAEADLVVEVVLEGISPGDPARGELPYVVGELRASEVYVDRAGVVPVDGALRLRIGQGPYRGATGKPVYPVAHFRQALPAGTRMVVFSEGPARGDLLDTYWQGLLVDDCGVLVGGKEPLVGEWASYRTLDDLTAFLRG